MTNIFLKKFGEVLYAPADAVLPMRDVIHPNLMYISADRADIIAGNNVVRAPELMIKILSEVTATTDQTSKKDLYQRYGTREYRVLTRRNEPLSKLSCESMPLNLSVNLILPKPLASPALEGFSLPVETVFPKW